MPNQKVIIKDLRENSNLSQDEFADLLGVSKRTVAYWERGEKTPQPKMLRKIDELLVNPRKEGVIKPGEKINTERALVLALLDDYLDWKSKETGGDYKALKAAVFEKANLILRGLDKWPFSE